MAKRALLAEDLDLDVALAKPGAGKPQAAFHERPAAVEPSPVSPSKDDKAGVKGRAVATTIYLLPDDHRHLRRMAIDRNVSFQTLVLDALDLLLQREGEASVTRWETRRKVR